MMQVPVAVSQANQDTRNIPSFRQPVRGESLWGWRSKTGQKSAWQPAWQEEQQGLVISARTWNPHSHAINGRSHVSKGNFQQRVVPFRVGASCFLIWLQQGPRVKLCTIRCQNCGKLRPLAGTPSKGGFMLLRASLKSVRLALCPLEAHRDGIRALEEAWLESSGGS